MQVIEIVTFKAKSGVSHNEVVEVNQFALKEIEKLEGFVYRSLAFDATSDTWTDVIYWDDKDKAKAAGEQFMKSSECQNLMDIVEKESTNMMLADILYSSPCTETENCG